MDPYHYEAVLYADEPYCIECLTSLGVDPGEALPIRAGDEWFSPGAVCSACGKLHDYMVLSWTPEEQR